MAGGRENLQEAQRKSDDRESKSDEETKERSPDFSREQRNRGPGQTPDLSRSQRNWGRTPDLSRDQRNKRNEDEDTHGPENSQNQRSITRGSTPSSEMMEGKGIAESSKENCRFFLKNGWCGLRETCRFNHPPFSDESKDVCQFYLRDGRCKFGTNCRHYHPPNREMMREDCQFYVNNGWCRNGRKCLRIHPNRDRMPNCRAIPENPGVQRTETQENVQEPPDKTSMPICKFFQRGSCSNGFCRFKHIKPELVQKKEPESSRSRTKKREIPENRGVKNLEQQNKRQRTEAQDNVQENQALGGAQDNNQGQTWGLSRDQRNRTNEDEDIHGPENSKNQRSIPSSDKSKEKMREECQFYVNNGWCRHKTKCPRIHPNRDMMPICEFFLKGNCLLKRCGFQHIKPEVIPENRGVENLQQQINERQRTEAQDNVQENQAVVGAQENQQEQTWGLSRDQRNRTNEDEDIHGPENSQNQRSITLESIPSSDKSKELVREECQFYIDNGWCLRGTNCPHFHPNRDRIPIYEVIPENLGVDNLQQQINERQRTDAQDNVQENQAVVGAQDNLQVMPEAQNVDAHQDQPNLEGKKERDIQRERMEARQRLEQMKPTVEFNDLDGLRKTLDDLGIERRKNDGF